MNAPVLFESGETPFSPAKVLSAAALWGELDPLAESLRAQLKRVAQIRAEGLEADTTALQTESERFRRARGLRTAQATEAWMAAWGVTLESFTEFLELQALCGPLDLAAQTDAGDASRGYDTELLDALWPAAVFAGHGEDWCRRLAARVAATGERGSSSDLPASLFDPASVPGLAPAALRQWMERLDLPASWFDQLIGFEAAYARFAESVQTPARLDAVMRARWSALFTMDFEMGGFRSEAAAREACLCVTEDGVPIEEICAMAGGRFHQGRVMLGDVPDGVRTRALSATAGALLPVFAWNDQYVVCRVRDKSEPSLDDAAVREATGRVVLEDALRPLVHRHIRWAPGIAG